MEIGLVIVLAIVIVEMLLSGTFTSFYFTIGIPIFWRKVTCPRIVNTPPSTDRLEATFSRGAYPAFIFRDLNDLQYAFRERAWSGFFKFHYTPVMHGLVTFDGENRQVRVVGLANWFPIAFVALFAFNLPPSDAAVFGVFLCGLVLLLYAIQARRFSQVATTAAALWCEATQEPLQATDAPVVRLRNPLTTLGRALLVSLVAVPLIAMALMLIGTFTEEWTCHEEGGDWKCVGGSHCNAEAMKRFDTFRRTVSCKRTDWPMVPLEKTADFFVSTTFLTK